MSLEPVYLSFCNIFLACTTNKKSQHRIVKHIIKYLIVSWINVLDLKSFSSYAYVILPISTGAKNGQTFKLKFLYLKSQLDEDMRRNSDFVNITISDLNKKLPQVIN